MVLGFIVAILIALSACGKKPQPDDDDQKQPPAAEQQPPRETLDATKEENIIEFCNKYLDRLTQQSSPASANLDEMLEQMSFSVDQFSYVGEHDDKPELLVMRDKALFLTGKEYDGENDVSYTTVYKLYDNGSAVIKSFGDKSSIEVEMNGTMPKPQEGLEAIKLTSKDIGAYEEDTMYLISKAYVKRLVGALGLTNDTVSMLGITLDQLCQLTFVMDFGRYDKDRVITISATGDFISKDIVLTLDLSEWNEETGKISLSLDIPATTVRCVLEKKDGDLLETDVTISVDGTNLSIDISYTQDKTAQPLPASTPREACDTVKFYAGIKVGGTEKLSMTLNAAELVGNRYAGSFTFAFSDGYDGLIPASFASLSSASSNGIDIAGSFDLGCDENDALTDLSAAITIEASEGKLELQLDADLVGVAQIGHEAVRAQMTLTEPSGANTVEKTVLLTLTTESYSEGLASFALAATATDGVEEGSLTAKLHWPAKGEITLNEQAEEYLERADNLFGNLDKITEKINEVNQRAINYVQRNMQKGAPLRYCYFDTEINQYLFTDITVQNNTIYVNTNCVPDYENYLFFYALHDGSFASYTVSEASLEAESVQMMIDNSYNGYFILRNTTFLVSVYLPEREMYLVMYNGNPSSASFYTERVTQDMVSGNVLHEVTVNPDGTLKIHNFESSYDENCMKYLTCKDCGFKLYSYDPEHRSSSPVEIREGDGETAQVVFCECDNCGEMYLEMTDRNGAILTLRLSPASEVTDDKQYGENALVITRFEFSSPGAVYEGAVDIPNIDQQTGYRIVGVTHKSSAIPYLPYDLTLPEGLEFIGIETFYAFGLTSISLPSSLRTIGDRAFLGCYAKEIVIPENVTTVGIDALSMRSLERITVNALFIDTFYLPNEAPLLKEIAFNGQIRCLVGSSTCAIETLLVPEGATTVGGFSGNVNLKKLVLPSTLTNIESGAFTSCTALKEVVLPEGLETIGLYAFSGCSSLSVVWVNGGGATEGEVGRLILPDTLKNLEPLAFARCSSLQSVRIPASIKIVSTSVFENCENLTTVELHDAITEISANAFKNCARLSDIELPDSLITIGVRAFGGCASLTDEDVVFGDQLQTIGQYAFDGCSGILNLRLPESMTNLAGTAFDGCQLETLYVSGKLAFDPTWSATVGEITLAKGFTGKLPQATVVNIMSYDVPEATPNMVNIVAAAVSVINFAGTEEAWEKGSFHLLNPETQINFNVVFD